MPTMGALHEGHLHLVEHAASHSDVVVVSIFVNRTQFGPNEDYDAYPRTLDADRQILVDQGFADVIFAPSDQEMYPDLSAKTWVSIDQFSDHLCGVSRPGHFKGVATVVTKLLNICQPHLAVFGLKDAQQFFIIRKMAADLNLDVEIVGVTTVRERDGLALSSRNKYLSNDERAQAVVLFRAVSAARHLLEEGERKGDAIRAAMRAELEVAELGRIDYAELVTSDRYQPVDTLSAGITAVAAVSVYFGEARLIDNAIVEIPGE